MKAEELELYAVKEWEYQLWYEEKWMKEAKVMADNLNLDSGLNIAGIFALAIEEPDKDFTFRRERDTAIFLADLEKTEPPRSEEHTSELQSRGHLVCRLLL